METAKMQLEISTNAQSLHNSLNRSMNSYNKSDREIGKSFNSNKPLQQNNSADRNAHQKQLYNKNFSNSKFGNNPVNNIDEDERIYNSSDDEDQFVENEEILSSQDQNKSEENNNNSYEESEEDVLAGENILAEVTKNSQHPTLKPPVSVRMGNYDKVNDF
jgi:hypothetical protein